MKLYKNMENIVVITIDSVFFRTNMNLLAFHADITQTIANTKLVKFKVNEKIFLIDSSLRNKRFSVFV